MSSEIIPSQERYSFSLNIPNIKQKEVSDLKDNSSFVVREIELETLEDRYRGKLNGDFSAVQLAELGKSLFNELCSNYEICSPVKFFFGKNEDGQSVLLSVVDKIEPILPLEKSKGTVTQKFSQLY